VTDYRWEDACRNGKPSEADMFTAIHRGLAWAHTARVSDEYADNVHEAILQHERVLALRPLADKHPEVLTALREAKYARDRHIRLALEDQAHRQRIEKRKNDGME